MGLTMLSRIFEHDRGPTGCIWCAFLEEYLGLILVAIMVVSAFMIWLLAGGM